MFKDKPKGVLIYSANYLGEGRVKVRDWRKDEKRISSSS